MCEIVTGDILQAEYWYTPSKRTGEKPRRWAGEELTCEWDLKDRLHFSRGGVRGVAQGSDAGNAAEPRGLAPSACAEVL